MNLGLQNRRLVDVLAELGSFAAGSLGEIGSNRAAADVGKTVVHRMGSAGNPAAVLPVESHKLSLEDANSALEVVAAVQQDRCIQAAARSA